METLEILKQLGALEEVQLDQLAEFSPIKLIKNLRGIIVGESRPVFNLEIQ